MPSTITIYHNPRCSKSRQTLSIIEAQGIKPVVVKYLESPPTVAELARLVSALGITTRALLRKGEEDYKALNLDDKSLTDQQLIEAMVKAPKLIERPIVVKGNKAVLGRPPENVKALL